VAWQGTAASAVPGTRLWASRYNGPGNGFDQPAAVAASSRGGRVFVTGYASGAGSGFDYATIAYSGATGARLWVKRYNGPANSDDYADAVAVSPDGRTVFVTGHSQGTA
jgi:DNA-binding beta-propeller fold protein YncE